MTTRNGESVAPRAARRARSFGRAAGAALALAVFSGCFATAKQLESVQSDVTKKEAWSGERLSRVEAEVEELRAENDALRQRVETLSDQVTRLGSDISSRFDEMGKEFQASSQRADEMVTGREKDREDILNRMNVILDELVKENSRLSERIKKLESNAVAFGKIHKVKKGETLASIARKYGSSVEAIAQANGIPEDASIEIGQELLIPGTSP
jgi:LysM repeat protein